MTTKTPAQELREIAANMSAHRAYSDAVGIGRGIDALTKLADRIEREQPRVVMPPRAILVGGPEVYEGVPANIYARIYNDGWNECHDEFKRLNAVDSARGK